MAERRMFTNKITESDSFLDMPLSTQALYFHLCMNADDDGFVKNPKRIARMMGASEDDSKLLVAKSFVINYESGIIVIKHWRMHNLLRKDRYKETEYLEEKSMLNIKENGAYTLDTSQGEPLMATKWQPDGNQMATQDRLGKDSIGKVSIVKDSIGKDSIDNNKTTQLNDKSNKSKKNPIYFPEDEKLNNAFKDYVDMRKKIKAPMTDKAVSLAINKLKQLSSKSGAMDNDLAIQILEQSIMNSWKGLFEIKREVRNSNGSINWDEV